MKQLLFLAGWIFFSFATSFAQHTDAIGLPLAKFATGDDPAFRSVAFDDSHWKEIRTGEVWQAQGFSDYHGYAWYRIHIKIPSSLRTQGHWKDSLRIYLAHVNDVDETWLNGRRIGKTGGFPEDPTGYISKWPAVREYHVAINDTLIKWDQDNVIAVRDYDGGGTGGIFMGHPYLDMLERTDGVILHTSPSTIHYRQDGQTELPVVVQNTFQTQTEGVFSFRVYDVAAGKDLRTGKESVRLTPGAQREWKILLPSREGIECSYTFTESGTGLSVSGRQVIPYILTPSVGVEPRIHSPAIFGVRPGSPVLFKIAATGNKPLVYQVTDLPAGLQLDAGNGLISGVLKDKGEYLLHVLVKNAHGRAAQVLHIRAGEELSLTPPMGWNSWNCWGLSVSSEKVRSSAQALIDKGLIDHGWTYINIDDGWQLPQRNKDSGIVANDKFPSMKELGDWLHTQGLKFGIYSSPGPLTCGGYLGSYRHEGQDADRYAAWGVDYLKYDWCSYDGIAGNDTSLETYELPYRKMQDALRKQQRDIVYSLCQYGMKDVWTWGGAVGGQSWRTTEDIEDTWESLSRIGFEQAALYPYAKPGNWNDPDMMIVGQVGWGENLHPSRLTPDEQYTHVSLWCLLSAPLLIGCDISRMDPFTLSLLTNDEVLAIDQDPLGHQARRVFQEGSLQVWVKELEDGSKAVGLFNTDTAYQKVTIRFQDLHWPASLHLRDVWRQQDLGVFNSTYSTSLAPHGVRLLQIIK